VAWQELRAVLDEEVQRLPEAQRVAFLLCVLQERSPREAAADLGLNMKTLESRLTRAKGRLRQRLSRRGLSLPTVLAATGASAVPGSLLAATGSVLRSLTSGAPLPARVGALLKGVKSAMLWSTLKSLLSCALVFGTVTGATGLFYHTRPPAAEVQEPAAEEKPARRSTPPPATKPAEEKPEDAVARMQKAIARAQTFVVSCTCTTINKTYQTTQVLEGTFIFARAERAGGLPRASLELREKGHADVVERLVFDGTKLYSFEPGEKILRVVEVPPDWRNWHDLFRAPGKSLLLQSWLDSYELHPFGLLAGQTAKSYKLAEIPAPPKDRWYVYLKVQPRPGSAEFTAGRLVLSRETYLPRQLWFQQPNENEMTWDFLRINEGAAIPAAEFAPALPAGWRLVHIPPEK
jgi:hypothetical protein